MLFSFHRASLLALVLLLAAACGPQQPHGGHGVFGMRHGLHGIGLATRVARLGMHGTRGRGGFRRACADDVARLCPNAKDRRDERQCLEGKQTSLSAECRDALNRRRGTAR